MTISNKNIDQAIRILKKQMKDLPDPSVTLVGKRWKDPFLVLISCVLSLRTKDATTLPASERLFRLADSVDGMLALKPEEIEKAVYPVGFYRTKARTILGICRDLKENFDGRVPADLEALMSMKGVGRKTANLVLVEGFGIPAICVDTHVHRISNRLGYVQTLTPHETEMKLREILPKKHWIGYNALLVVWGQNICKPISPMCSLCGVRRYCAREGVGTSR